MLHPRVFEHTTGSLRHFNAIMARSKGLRTLLDDVLAARTPDVDKADRLQRALIEGAAA